MTCAYIYYTNLNRAKHKSDKSALTTISCICKHTFVKRASKYRVNRILSSVFSLLCTVIRSRGLQKIPHHKEMTAESIFTKYINPWSNHTEPRVLLLGIYIKCLRPSMSMHGLCLREIPQNILRTPFLYRIFESSSNLSSCQSFINIYK